MTRLLILLSSLLVLCLAFSEEDPGEIDCYGEFGDLEGAERNKMDKYLGLIMKKLESNFAFGFITRRIIKASQNPDSLLRQYLGTFGQETRGDSFEETQPTKNIDSRWLAILNKVFGEGRTVVSFLWKYGYIPKILNISKKGSETFSGSISPCALTNAVMEFQRFHQITPIDGRVTKETRDLMAQDRCGNADVECETEECLVEDNEIEDDDDGYLKRKRRYVVQSKIWRPSFSDGKVHLNFWYEKMYNPNDVGKKGHAQMTEAEVRYQVEKGFAAWTKYAGVNLKEVKSKKKADIKILFGQDKHGEKRSSAAFDGPLGVLAHMYYPRSGKMHFDQAENFTSSVSGPGINLYFVAAHEMGHGLGIKHSRTRGALMYAYYSGYKDPMLEQDDISAVQELYGTEPGSLTNLFDYSEIKARDPSGDW